MNRGIANAVAGATTVTITGEYQRYTGPKGRPLRPSTGGGRWSPPDTCPTLYLGSPEDSVVAEAYKRHVDPLREDGMRGDLVRNLVVFTMTVHVTNVLDLRDPETLDRVGLDEDALTGRWGPCQRVGGTAYRLGIHGVIAPSSTGIGATLALYDPAAQRANEWPTVASQKTWATLPADPRPTHSRDQEQAGD